MNPLDGMESDASTRLRDMRLAAQYVVHTIVELETVVKSVENLIPSEENQPVALETMKTCYEKCKLIEEDTEKMKNNLLSLLASVRKEKEEAMASKELIVDGIRQIEGTLKNYGYDESRFPHYDPQNLIKDSESCQEEDDDSIVSIDESSIEDEINSLSLDAGSVENGNENSPHRVEMNVSMSGVEITPYVSGSSHQQKIKQEVLVTPLTPSILKVPSSSVTTSIRKMSPFTPSSKLKLPKLSPNPYLSRSPTLTYSCQVSLNVPKSEPQKLMKPQRPVLSKTFYEITGEKPPPESY